MQKALTRWHDMLGERLTMGSGNAAVHVASLLINLLALALPIVLMQIYDRVIPNQNRATLVVLGIGLLGAVIAEVVIRNARSRLMSYAGARYEVDTTLRLCRHFLHADATEIEKTPPGVHVGRLTAIDRIRDFRSGDAGATALDLPFSVLFLVAVAWIATPIAVLLFSVIGVTILVVRRLTKASEALAAERATLEGRRHSFLIEVLSRIEPVKSAGINAFMERRYERLMKSSAATTAAFTATSTVAQGVIGAVSQLTPVAVGAVGAILVSFNAMSIGALAAVILLSGRAIQPIMRLEALVAGDLNTRRLEEDLEGALATAAAKRGTADPGPIETVSLRNVACIKKDDGSHVLERVNLDLKRGEIIGIRGLNGSGKSSVVGLMAGQVLAEQGEVLINDTPIEEISPSALAGQIAMLPDRPTLLDGTVLENMTRFRPQDHLDEAIELATALGMDRYFAAHPDGLSMKIRQGVSAGLPTSVIDRVALVAGLLGNPSLVLFDEANMSLDFEGDALLREHLFARRQSAAVVLVTQRPSYLKGCDRLYRIEDGKLVADDGSDLPFNQSTPHETAARMVVA
jgi:ATP-binding cassette, subfamily C, bacterial LapB